MKQPIRKLNGRRPHSAQDNASERPIRRVVAALILRGEGDSREIFICQRRPDQPMGLKWEFPGGKIEPGESSTEALARELNEELGIHASIGERITTVHHTYRNGAAIEIEFFTIPSYEGQLDNRIFQQMLWSPVTKLLDYDFLAADLTLIRDLADGKLL